MVPIVDTRVNIPLLAAVNEFLYRLFRLPCEPPLTRFGSVSGELGIDCNKD